MRFRSLCITLLSLLLTSSLQTLAKERHAVPDSMIIRSFCVGNATFTMRFVDEGMFVMGATPEQRSDYVSSDRPAHCVNLSAFYIGVTEVTQGLWREVMDEWKSPEEWSDPNCPANWLNWFDAQEFVRRLDSITGLPFRLPTEAEWEYAARGAQYTKGFRFAGHNKADSVGWGLMNSGHHVHPVMQRMPNELGLYDMTGNVSEWCSDWFAPYYLATEPNPAGPEQGEEKVLRGGSWDNCEDNRHISYRLHHAPDYLFSDCGLRLAMDVDCLTEQQEKKAAEPEMTIKIKVGKKPLFFRYVPAEQPFYIAETELTCQQWKEVMSDDDVDKSKLIITGVKRSEQIELAEKLQKQSGQPVAIASEEEVLLARNLGVLSADLNPNEQPYYRKNLAAQQKHRKAIQNASKWTELVGIRLDAGEDPILNSYSADPVEDKPIRLIIRIK